MTDGAMPDSAGDPIAVVERAESLIGQKRLAEAERIVRPLVEQAPDFIRARLALGRSLMLQCRHREALELMEDWTRLHPHDSPALQLLAQVFADKGDFDRAAAAYGHFLELNSQDVMAWLSFAITLRFAGRKTEAEEALRRAIAIDPTYGALWWTLCNMAPDSISTEDLESMRETLACAEYVDDASQLHVAIGTMLDRAGDYTEAFEHFTAGKALRARASAYQPSEVTAHVDCSIAAYSADFMASSGGHGAQSPSPIFLIGMPRSGSTLIERVLGSHSQIEAAGELPIIPRLVDELDAEAGGIGQHLRLISEASPERLRELGERYLLRSKEFRRTCKPFFTDKLHMNWRYLGLIRLILPNARIIDVRRDAVECCWSNFRTLFSSGHPASDDLRWIGHFCREYVRYADHIAGQASNRQLTVSYEAAVENLECETRRLSAFLDLPYEPESLNFHLLEDPIATASAEQVRRPLNREGIGRSLPYRRWLGPMIEALGPLADER